MNELTKYEGQGQLSPPLTANDIIGQVRLIQQVMEAVMRDKEHYGTIPGCGDKPTLLQPGAQKLLMTFRLAPEYEVFQTDMERGHREYRVQCTLKSIGSGAFCGTGVGACSTMEGKFRFRVAPKAITDRPVPKAYWDLRGKDPKEAQKLLGGPGFGTKKDDSGQWMITEGSNEKVEHDNPADYYNTVLKMAKKRALVDATLTATAASDIFTCDVEEMPEIFPEAANGFKTTEKAPKPASEPSKVAEQPQDAARQTKATQSSNGASRDPFAPEAMEDCFLVDFQEKTGTSARGDWVAWFCQFEDLRGQDFKAGTFDKKIGDAIETLKGQKVTLRHKQGKKDREILSIMPCDEL